MWSKMHVNDKGMPKKLVRFSKSGQFLRHGLQLNLQFSTRRVTPNVLKIAPIDPQRNFTSDYVVLEFFWPGLDEIEAKCTYVYH